MIFKSDAFHFFIGHCWTLNHFEPSSGLGPCYWRGRVCCEITMFKYLTTWQSMKTSLTKKHSVLSEVQYCHIHSSLIHFSPIVLKIMTPDALSFFSSHTQPALLSGTVEHMASSFPTAANSNLTANQSSPFIHWSCPVCPQETPVTLHVCWLLITAIYSACTILQSLWKAVPIHFLA